MNVRTTRHDAAMKVAFLILILLFSACSTKTRVTEILTNELLQGSDTTNVLTSSNIWRTIDENCVLDIIPMVVKPDGSLQADTTKAATRVIKASSMRYNELSRTDSTIVHQEQKERNTEQIEKVATEYVRKPFWQALSQYWHTCIVVVILILVLWLSVKAILRRML